MIETVKSLLIANGIRKVAAVEALAEVLIGVVAAEIAGDLRADLPLAGACSNCLEIRRKAIEIVIAKAEG